MRAASIGVRVKATTSETMMAKVAVRPNKFQNFPTRPPMKATGRKITTSETVVAVTASEISFVPDGGLEGRPPLLLGVPEDVLQHDDGVVDDDARGERQTSMVRLFSVKPAIRIAVKVAMIDTGIARAATNAAAASSPQGRRPW